jgi:hypothetical protein
MTNAAAASKHEGHAGDKDTERAVFSVMRVPLFVRVHIQVVRKRNCVDTQ